MKELLNILYWVCVIGAGVLLAEMMKQGIDDLRKKLPYWRNERARRRAFKKYGITNKG